MSKLGLKAQVIQVASTSDELRRMIAENHPEVVFIDNSLVAGKLAEIVELQENSVPAGRPRVTFLMSGGGSGSEASSAADEQVDAVIAKPFTFDSLEGAVLKALDAKYQPKLDQKMINDGLAFLKSKNYSEAVKYFEEAKKMAPESAQAAYYVGHTRFELKEWKAAQNAYEDGLRISPAHYRCLLGMIDLFSELKDYGAAYEYAQALARAHPIPMKKIPKFVHLSILNLKFEDVLSFYQFVDQASTLDEEISGYLGSGLVVCGLFFLRKEKKEEAAKAFLKAEAISRKNPRIFARILLAMSESGLEAEAIKFSKRVPPEIQESIEFQSAHLELKVKEDPAQALKIALEIIANGKATVQIFQTAIDLSFQVKRKKSVIEMLLERARSSYPERYSVWDGYDDALAKTGEG
jgi:tetratricopeptide (TPR) repeat protein